MAETQEKPLNELLSRDMVDIYVGQENTHWILHEKLLCYRSKFFNNIFKGKENKDHKFGLPDEEDEPFRLFVGWLYSSAVPTPKEEKDLGNLFELYLMSEKWAINGLTKNSLEAVRNFYKETDTYPALRRVQYIYSNTEQESPMRQLLVGSVARMLVLGEGLPAHWEKALKKNGQLAVDIMIAMQKWGLTKENIPDARQDSVVPIMEDSQNAKDKKDDTDGGAQNEENDDEEEQGEEEDEEQDEQQEDDEGEQQEGPEEQDEEN